MSALDDAFLAKAFFDSPSLLAVRFERQGADAVATFAVVRRPDTQVGLGVGTVITVIGFGVVATLVGGSMLRGCVGTSTSLSSPHIDGAVATNSGRHTNWSVGLDHLADDLAPKRADLLPFFVRTLLDVPRELARRGDATGGWLQPRCTDADRQANRRGAALAETLDSVGAGSELAVILDLPGPLAVAAATGMANHFDPVFTIDNLPHPTGVVPSAQTLAAAIYWRSGLMATKAARRADAPPVFVLEGERLVPYANQVESFDNRSAVRLPDDEALRALGINRILYVREHRGAVAEADDLTELFLAFAEAGIEVKHLALDSVPLPQLEPTNQTTHMTHTYTASPWFWNSYGWYRPAGSVWNGPSDDDARFQTTQRPTMFTQGISRQSLDGGGSKHEAAIQQLSPSRPTSSGGSWSRSSGSSWS